MFIKRPVFIPQNTKPFVIRKDVESNYYYGDIPRSLDNLHLAIEEVLGIDNIIEVSGVAKTPFARNLSAFNLVKTMPTGLRTLVESAYQGSKVFEKGGPYRHLYNCSGRSAKRHFKNKEMGALVAFDYCGIIFPIEPKYAFYNYLYLNALIENNSITQCIPKLTRYDAFTDYYFSPKKSVNCQAHAAAMCVGLYRAGLLDPKIIKDKDKFIELIG